MRYRIIRSTYGPKPWHVLAYTTNGRRHLAAFSQHAHAIAYADNQGRRQSGAPSN